MGETLLDRASGPSPFQAGFGLGWEKPQGVGRWVASLGAVVVVCCTGVQVVGFCGENEGRWEGYCTGVQCGCACECRVGGSGCSGVQGENEGC